MDQRLAAPRGSGLLVPVYSRSRRQSTSSLEPGFRIQIRIRSFFTVLLDLNPNGSGSRCTQKKGFNFEEKKVIEKIRKRTFLFFIHDRRLNVFLQRFIYV